jgi:transcriptional regulator with XRE-family HTH domain
MERSNSTIAKEVTENAALWRGVRRSDPTMQIRSRMREKGLKNSDLAQRIGVSEANISRWLRGNQNISIDNLYSLADAIEEPLTILFGEISYSFQENDLGWTDEVGCQSIWDTCNDNVIDMAPYIVARRMSLARAANKSHREDDESLSAFA